MTSALPFVDRAEAGRLLADELTRYGGSSQTVVLALPRGGVPVAFEVAHRLKLPLDILAVRKISVPWEPEVAIGAVASGGVTLLDRALIRMLNVSAPYVKNLVCLEEKELQSREALFRTEQLAHPLSDSTVILIDDGAATGATMIAAARAARKQGASRLLIAIPVASSEALSAFESEVDECICLAAPEPFIAVGRWYESFRQVDDQEVQSLLRQSRAQMTA